MSPACDRLNKTSLDELRQRGLGNAHMAADPDEPDTPLLDQSPWKPLGCPEQLSDLAHGQQPLHRRCP
jgi:hypothetical protein